MATPFEDNFDAYSLGAVNGQGDWVSDGALVSDDRYQSSPYCLKIPSLKYASKEGTRLASGVFYFWVYFPTLPTNKAIGITFKDNDGTFVGGIYFVEGYGTTFVYNSYPSGGSFSEITPNAWHLIGVRWADNNLQYSIDRQGWGGDTDITGKQIARFIPISYVNTTYSFYIDTIHGTETVRYPLADDFESYADEQEVGTFGNGWGGYYGAISEDHPCTGVKSLHLNDRGMELYDIFSAYNFDFIPALDGIQYFEIMPWQTGFSTAGNMYLQMSGGYKDALILYFVDNGTNIDVRFGDLDGPYTGDPITTIPRNAYTKLGVQWAIATGYLRLSFDGGATWGSWFEAFDGAGTFVGIDSFSFYGWDDGTEETSQNEYYIDDLSAGGGVPEYVETLAGLADCDTNETEEVDTTAGFSELEEIAKDTLGGTSDLWDGDKETLAGIVGLEKEIKNSFAGKSQLEVEKIQTLGGITETQTELEESLAGNSSLEKEQNKTLGGMADCYSLDIDALAGLVTLETRKENGVAGFASFEENSGHTLAGLCVLEERTQRALAGKATFEKGKNNVLAGIADLRYPYTTVQFNGLDINNIVEITERAIHDSAPSRIIASYKIARRDGEKLVSSFFAKKEIDVTGFIQSTTRAGLETLIDNFKAQLQAVGYLDIEYATSTRRYYAVFSELTIQREPDHLDWCPFSIKFIVPSGKGQNLTETIETVNGITSNAHSGYLVNLGSAEALPKFTITVNSATSITVFQITAGGKAITIYDTISAGDIIVVNFDTFDVTINGYPADYTGTWPKFPTGSTWYSIALDGTGSSRNYNLVIDYYPQYL